MNIVENFRASLNRSQDVVDGMIARHNGHLGATAMADCSISLPLAGSGWPEPLPLAAKIDPDPYPLDALPDTIQAAVEEVQGYVKAPVALVASSALGALSLACQAHIDVARDDYLQGPTSLFILTIADSGERKSTCDGFFMETVHQYQDEQTNLKKSEMEDYRAALAAWKAEYNGVETAIRDAAKQTRNDKRIDKLKTDLMQLEYEKPIAPRIPRLLYADATPESLALNLATGWPSAGIISSEAGSVLGSHGMTKDSIQRNLTLLNILWDGGELSVDRKTTVSFIVRDARLTIYLQIQEAALRDFLIKSGVLARGVGFLARFLVAWPESTQGTRWYSAPPESWPRLSVFNQRLSEILNHPVSINEDGGLMPAMSELSPDAKAAWVNFSDEIEDLLGNGGELYDVRDVASKTADNAARLAALFQMFEHGAGAVSLDNMKRASTIVAWHLAESRRFFGELALPLEVADAVRLDTWLIDHCRRGSTHIVARRDAQRLGKVRTKDRLDAAIAILTELNRVEVKKHCGRVDIYVNPALLEKPS
ncbi:MAG: DUF3987 domain-containing protein [Zoogloeaceae bacterium]|jgi:putative DNA primase/helicase|nr:DUF3987 domain-containing protein [Zoogloeaceae bacterium]